MKNKIKKHPIIPDPVYNNITVARFINQIMRKGKKTIARKIVYKAFDIIKEKTKKEPLEVFELALRNASPLLDLQDTRGRLRHPCQYRCIFEAQCIPRYPK